MVLNYFAIYLSVEILFLLNNIIFKIKIVVMNPFILNEKKNM